MLSLKYSIESAFDATVFSFTINIPIQKQCFGCHQSLTTQSSHSFSSIILRIFRRLLRPLSRSFCRFQRNSVSISVFLRQNGTVPWGKWQAYVGYSRTSHDAYSKNNTFMVEFERIYYMTSFIMKKFHKINY